MTDSSMSSTSDNKDLSDVELLLKAVDYDQSLQAGSSRARFPIKPDHELVEERLTANYFRANGDPQNIRTTILDVDIPEYLRKPYFNDTQKLYIEHNAVHGFSGMLGSIDCMHWEWINCLKA
ncbi:transcription elongation factor SPT6 [Tanacetum coccineum]